MSWVRLDDQFPDHPKVASLSNDAFCLHVTAMCYTAKHQTDGQLPCVLLRRLSWRCHDPAMALAELIASGVWDVNGEEGWTIHDYLDYNPSKAEIEALAETRSVAGKVGAAARWQDHSKSHGKPHSKADGKNMPPSPSPSDDKEWQQALSDMQVLGLWNKNDRDRFADMWPELTGRHDWVGKAITLTRDKNVSAGIPYVLKVLANAIHTGKEPGYVNGAGETPKPRPSYANPEALERSRRIEECALELATQGITQDTDHMWLVKLDDLIEAKYGYRP